MYNIVTGSNLNLNNIGKNEIQQDFGGTILGIAANFRKFAEKFAKVGNNYLKTPILNCNIFGYGRGMNENLITLFSIQLSMVLKNSKKLRRIFSSLTTK